MHRLLSVFGQPCTRSKWASNHLEQKPFLAHILWVPERRLYRNAIWLHLCLSAWMRFCVRVCAMRSSACWWAVYTSALSSVAVISWTQACRAQLTDSQGLREGWGAGGGGSEGLCLPLKARSALCINLPLQPISHSCPLLCDRTSDTFGQLPYLRGRSFNIMCSCASNSNKILISFDVKNSHFKELRPLFFLYFLTALIVGGVQWCKAMPRTTLSQLQLGQIRLCLVIQIRYQMLRLNVLHIKQK